MRSTLSDKRMSLSFTNCLSTKLLMALASTVILGSESSNFIDGSRNLQTTDTLSFVTSQSQSYVTTKDQSVLVSSPIWGPRSDLCYCQTVMDLSMWSGLSNERRGLSFTTVIISKLYMSSIFTILHGSILHRQLSRVRFLVDAYYLQFYM
jgi:hypothetical protein